MLSQLQRNGFPKGFIQKQTCRRADRDSMQDSETHATLTLPYVSGLSESIRQIFSPLSIQVSFRPLRTLKQKLVHLKDPVLCLKGRELSTASFVLSVPAPTLDRLGGHWTSACNSIIGPSRREMSPPRLWQSMCLKQATRSTCPRLQ